jgi:hypothetical protein
VRIAELEAVAVQVEGVEYVVGSGLGVPDGAGGFTPRTTVELDRWEVPELVALTVASGSPLPVGGSTAPTDPGTLVPLPPDVC